MPVAKPAVPVATKRTVVPLASAKKAAPAPAPAPAKKLAAAKAAPAPAKAVRAAPAPAAEATDGRHTPQRGINLELAGKKVTVLVENPKRGKCREMFDLYKTGMTYEALREAGVTVADIRYNMNHEPPFISFK